jgi:large subunit ribosomal protein L18
MARYKTKKEQRDRRHKRLRQKVSGSAARPRLCVCFTNLHMYAQFIDDDAGRTLAAVSSTDRSFRDQGGKANMAGAELLGKMAVEKAAPAGIRKIVFDRGGFRFHGRVKAFADSVRAGGIEF